MHSARHTMMTCCWSALLALFFAIWSQGSLYASDPRSAVYSSESQKIFWFLVVSDTHIGANGFDGEQNLEWVVSEAMQTISPAFIVNTGDLTDSTNWSSSGYPDGPHVEEWIMYRSILDRNYVDATFYYDLPGNHDGFGDRDFSYYLNYSIQGSAGGQTQFSWNRTFDFGTYHFLAINTCGNEGSDFSFKPPQYGDNSGLDASEMQFIRNDLEANAHADLTMIFGHHLLVSRETDLSDPTPDPLEDMTMTALSYGGDEFISLMEEFDPLMYVYGHSHVYREEFFTKGMSEGVVYLNVASMTKNETMNYNIVAIDNNGLSTKACTIGTWPAVIITAPLDKNLGMRNDPYTTNIQDGTGDTKPIRALVFDKNPVVRVDYRMYKIKNTVGDVVDEAVKRASEQIEVETMWQPMTQVSPSHPSYPFLWTAEYQAPPESGDYTIEVRAIGSSTQWDAVPTSFPADPVDDDGFCFITTATGSGR